MPSKYHVPRWLRQTFTAAATIGGFAVVFGLGSSQPKPHVPPQTTQNTPGQPIGTHANGPANDQSEVSQIRTVIANNPAVTFERDYVNAIDNAIADATGLPIHDVGQAVLIIAALDLAMDSRWRRRRHEQQTRDSTGRDRVVNKDENIVVAIADDVPPNEGNSRLVISNTSKNDLHGFTVFIGQRWEGLTGVRSPVGRRELGQTPPIDIPAGTNYVMGIGPKTNDAQIVGAEYQDAFGETVPIDVPPVRVVALP